MATDRKDKNLSASLHRRIDSLQDDMIAFLHQFCGYATVNPPGAQYEDCVAFLEKKLLSGLKLKTRIVRVPPKEQLRLVPGSAGYPRPSIIGRWDVGAERTLLLTGHYDVVPPTNGWKADPFKLVRKGKKLIGRGSSDMKGSNTAAIFAVQAMQQAGITPPWNIELAFTPDEETGGYAGLGYLARNGHFDADAAILLEGGGGKHIGYAHRGVLWLDVTVMGKAGHAADPNGGVNALEKAIKLIEQLKTLEKVYAKRQSNFKVDKAIGGQPTLMIGGVCSGGGKTNTIPDRFHFTIDRRLRPEDRLPEVKAEIMTIIRKAQKRDRKLKVEVKFPLHVSPGWTDEKHEICQIARRAVQAVMNKKPVFRMAGGFNDMHFLSRDAKIPTVCYGAHDGGGAHADSEFASIDGLLNAAKVYCQIIQQLPR